MRYSAKLPGALRAALLHRAGPLFRLPLVTLGAGMALALLLPRLPLVPWLLLAPALLGLSALGCRLDPSPRRTALWQGAAALALTWGCTAPLLRLAGPGGLSAALPLGVLGLLLAGVFFRSDTGRALTAALGRPLPGPEPDAREELQPGDVVICRRREEEGEGPPEILRYRDRFLHMLILGATGTGKTSQVLIPMIRQDLANRSIGVIVLEPKGDLAQKIHMLSRHCGRPSLYFDPSMDICPCFNPLAGRELDVVENMATTFRMLTPDSPTFFLDLNEQLIRNAIKVLKRLDRAQGVEGKNATLLNLSRLLQNTGGSGRALVQAFSRIPALTDSEESENRAISGWFLNDYFLEKSKVHENTSGLRSQVSRICSNALLRRVLNPDVTRGEHNDIDFDAALAGCQVLCISTAQGALRDLSRFLGYFLILQLQSAVFRRPGNEDTRPACMLYIDEFQTYSTPGFADMLTMGRSYRVASHLATQTRDQMAMGGGQDGRNFVSLVSTNARNVILFPGCSIEDARYYSRQFGEYEKTETQISISRRKFSLSGGLDKLGHPTESLRQVKKMTPRFSPTDLIYRPFGEIVYCIIRNATVQIPRVGLVSYIPADLNAALDREMEEYVALHQRREEETGPRPGGRAPREEGDFPPPPSGHREPSDPPPPTPGLRGDLPPWDPGAPDVPEAPSSGEGDMPIFLPEEEDDLLGL